MGVLTGMAVLAIGILFGITISYFIVVQKDRTSSLAKQLDEVHAEYASYQEQVDQHFRKTADLLNALSSNYGAMHQHLALGVQTLSQRNLQHVSAEHTSLQNSATGSDNVQPTALDALEIEPSTFTIASPDPTSKSTGNLSEPSTADTLFPPKDYAPKEGDAPGMLSEEFSKTSTHAPSKEAP